MNKKNLTVFFVGLLIATAIMVLFNNGNKTVTKDLIYAKAEMFSKDDPFARIEYERRMLADPVTGEIPENIRAKELSFASNLPTVESVSLNKGNVATWTMRGPINRGGRTRALGIDVRTQTAPNITIIAGGVTGGIYKSIDNGVTWVNKLSPGLIHSISCLAQDTRPGQENTWYAGTGEAMGTDFNGQTLLRGDGVYKSIDNGETWALLPSTSNGSVAFSTWKFVNNVSVNKSTGSIFAAASNVVMRSQDGGTSWNTVRSTLANNTMSDVQITSTGIIYAGIPDLVQDAGISTSADDGATWTNITPGGFPTNYGRIVIAIAPSNENIVYVWVFTGTGATQTELWKYDASTTNWNNLTANLPPPDPDPNLVSGINVQGSYNMVMKVKPDDENFVVVGATNLYRTTEGFSTLITSSGWIGGYATANNVSQYANHHPDNHSLVFLNSPNSNVLYSGHDGGLSRTDDVTQTPVTWSNISRGYITSQFFAIGIEPVTANDKVIAGGMQDNGNYSTFSGDFNTDWIDWNHGGDGGYAEVRKTGATDYTIYLEAQNGWLWRQQYTNGTLTADDLIEPPIGSPFAFVNPFVLDINNSDIMYFAAGVNVIRSTNVSSATPPTWQTLTNATTGNNVTALSISKTTANRLYVGTDSNEILKIDGANTGNPVAVDISAGLPMGYVNCIYVDPANADNIIAVLSNYGVISLWSSVNGGTNWTDISGNLEENPDGTGNGPSCRWVTSVNANGTMKYFVATSTGLYSTTNLNGNATIWAQEGPNTIGNVVCTMVLGRDLDDYAVVCTHGMGVFSSTGATPVEDESTLPENYSLSQNYPNPFNPSTTISFSLPEAGNVKLSLFDAVGSEVDVIAAKDYSAGYHSINYNASNLPSGVYFYRIETGSFVQSKKMVLMK